MQIDENRIEQPLLEQEWRDNSDNLNVVGVSFLHGLTKLVFATLIQTFAELADRVRYHMHFLEKLRWNNF